MSSGLIDSLATTDALASVFADDAVLQAMLDFEAALARAQARCGVISQNAAEAISAAAVTSNFDPKRLAGDSRTQATVGIPLVKALTDCVRASNPEGARFVHWGATSQDVTDTALVLLLRRAHRILADDHSRLSETLHKLSVEHSATVMLGRTLMQPAPPVTFGLKTAGWFAALRRNWARLDAAFADAAILQFGGAAGTLAALGDRGIEVSRLLGEELHLTVPAAPWHAHRDRIAAVITNCGIYTGTLGKIARDAALLMQHEVGSTDESGGGSSTMPHKRNPASFSVALACANHLPGLVANYLSGMVQEHERAVGGLQAEWATVAGVVEGTGAALSAVANGMEGLTVHPERMRQNIGITRGLVFSERVMMLIAGATGRDVAYKLLSDASQRALRENLSLAEVVRLTPDIAELLTPEQITGLDVPENYLGAAEIFRKQLLDS